MKNSSELRRNRRRQPVPLTDMDLLLLTDSYLGLEDDNQQEISSQLQIKLDKTKDEIRKRISEL
jgi:hypothetical protein